MLEKPRQGIFITPFDIYIAPRLNFEANDYTEMILWESTDVSITVPPVRRTVNGH